MLDGFVSSFGARRRVGTATAATLTGTPFIVGTGRVGDEHSVQGYIVGGIPQPEPAFEWFVGGVSRATTATYTPTDADAGGADAGFSAGFSAGFGGAPLLTVIVSAENSEGAATPLESAAIPILPRAPSFINAFIAEGGGSTGDTFSVTAETVDNVDSITYQWKLDGVDIAGAVNTSVTVTDAGALTCLVTAITAGITATVETEPVPVFHQFIAGLVGSTGATTATATFDNADEDGLGEISGQVFLCIVAYQGPVPTTVTLGGVTLTSFTEGASATSGGKTLTMRKSSLLSTDKRVYVFTLENLTGTATAALSFTTGTNYTYLKAHCYQIAGYDLDEIVLEHATGSSGTLSVAGIKTAYGLMIGMANRMPALATTPAAWTLGFYTDPAQSQWDVISGFVSGPDYYESGFAFSQPNPTTNQQAISVSLPSGTLLFPEMIAAPTISGTPTQGIPLTLNIAAASANTEIIEVRVYRVESSNVQVGVTIEYEVGSGDPAPTYAPTAADVGFSLILGETPIRGAQVGPERFSAATSAVLASGTTGPTQISSSLFEFEGTADEDGGVVTDGNGINVRRADFTIKAGISIPAGYEIALLRSLSPGIVAASGHPELQNVQTLAQKGIGYDGSADALWRSNGGAPNGVTQYGYVFLKHTASGALFDGVALVSGDTPYSFVSFVEAGEEEPDVDFPPPPDYPTANEVKSTAQNLRNALDARIASGSTAPWVIDLASGNYGYFNFNGRQLPGPTTIRSQNLSLGAKFPGVDLTKTKNVTLELVDVDRTLGGASSIAVNMDGATFCGLKYSRVHMGPITASTGKPGYEMNGQFGLHVNNTSGATPHDLTIHMNLFSGPTQKQMYFGACEDIEVSDNIGINAGVDFMHIGWGSRMNFLRNWGPRAYYTYYDNTQTPPRWGHNDFLQHNGRTSYDWIVKGNILMGQRAGLTSTGMPVQGLFANLSTIDGWLFEDNIICSNHSNGLRYGTETRNLTLRRNTLLRTIDQGPFAESKIRFNLSGPGPNTLSNNVQASTAGDTSMGSNGLNIVVSKGGVLDGTPQLAYYVNPRKDATFYELRPVAGAVTHWDFNGTKQGAYQRFRDVILGGQYPKYGPAATVWEDQYNWKGQITS